MTQPLEAASVVEAQQLRAPFPWFGGKRRVADFVWARLGDVDTYNEPFAGSLAVLLGRPHEPRVETVNDLDCVAPQTRILRWNLTYSPAGEIRHGDKLFGFDEHNGEARPGLRAPKRYRRLRVATVTAVRRLLKPCYRLTFDDGTTVVSSANHLWLGGSHKSGGRGWRWVKTESMVCNRKTQRSWVLKVADVHGVEDSHEAGWLGGILDGEGSIKAGQGLRVTMAQKEGAVLDRTERLFADRGYVTTRVKQSNCWSLQVNGGIADTLSLLMRVRPERLIAKLADRLPEVSLYGRSHRAVGLVSKEFLGEQEVVAIETDCHTFIAEGLASHNCYLANFWRALQHDPDGVAYHADSPVNEADLHARHRWLVETARATAERVMTDPDFFDPKIAGWWVWGQCLWIGSGWCQTGELRTDGTPREKMPKPPSGYRRWQGGGQGGGSGVHAPRLTDQKRPHISNRHGDGGGMGVHRSALTRKLPTLSQGGHDRSGGQRGLLSEGVRSRGLYDYLQQLAVRLRRVRVCCGDWKRVLTPSVTTYIGVTGVFLDPPYSHELRERCYAEDHDISADVRAWALAHGDDPNMRIALCGYEDEHGPHMPDTWQKVAWKAHGGYSRSVRGKANRERERIWFSKYCLKPDGLLPFGDDSRSTETVDAPQGAEDTHAGFISRCAP